MRNAIIACEKFDLGDLSTVTEDSFHWQGQNPSSKAAVLLNLLQVFEALQVFYIKVFFLF